MNLKKLEKRISRQKAKLDCLKAEKEELLKGEEEKKQEPQNEKKKKQEALTEAEKVRRVRYSYMRQVPLFYADRKSLKEFLAPDAVDPNNYGYLKLQDAGRDVYVRSYYIDRMPRNATFGVTFAGLYNFRYITSDTRIEPIPNEKAVQMLDRQVIDLDTELATARKSGDRNRMRKIGQKMGDTEGWARDLESGRNKLFNVTFLFHSYERTLENLNALGSDFHTKALGKNMSVVSCYGVEPEAYKSGFPLNRIYKSRLGPIPTTTARVHQMDTYSLSTIFNHTRSSFYHRNGVYLGRDLSSHQPVTIDFYDRSLEAHNTIFAGKTGTGKSATIKMILSRSADFGLKYCSIDSEARGRQGEYSILTKRLGGVNFQIRVNSQEIVNLFEISSELEYDEATGQEGLALHLVDKISILKGIIMTMITFGKSEPSFEDATALNSIIGDMVTHLYEIRGIREGEPDSLYASTAGYARVKKPLPTIREFFIEALKRQKDNRNMNHKKAYSLLIDSLKDYVKELYYIPGIVKILTKEEYESLPYDDEGKHYYETEKQGRIHAMKVKGVRSYYDGQSTIQADLDTPAINIDISQLPANDRPIAMVIACNFLNENIIKKNSANPKRVQKRAILIDEAHRLFRYKELREFLSDLYRSARKRFVAPICCTQALADFKGYEETEAIVKESPIIFLLRQAKQDKEYLASATCLTPAQMDRMLKLGGKEREDGSASEKGQICMIVNDRVVFVQVDYLKWTETDVVETNMQIIHEHIRQRRSREYAKKNH